MSNLVIVESPAKAKTIQKYLGKDYAVVASMGHVRDLPKSKISVDLENGFVPHYVEIESKADLIAQLKKEAEKADNVYLATDPDREGEAISWHLAQILDLPLDAVDRVTFNEITKSGIASGMANPRAIDQKLVDAQQARRILDRILGYKLSPFLWKKVRRGLSAGRVQSVAVRLIVDREEEVRAFKPEEYWTIDAKVQAKSSRKAFEIRLALKNGEKIVLSNEESAKAVLSDLEGAAYIVSGVKKSLRRRSPAPPFTTSTMQQEASRKLGFQARRTMKVAQELYEGVDVEELGTVGLITYMRTDSLRVSSYAQSAAKEYIESRYGSNYCPASPRVYRSRAGSQDAHEAIRPSRVDIEPAKIKKYLTTDQFKLYKLIWDRFVASQMESATLGTVTADFACGGYIFRTSGYSVEFPGYMALYEESEDDSKRVSADEVCEQKDIKLPSLKVGQTLQQKGVDPARHFSDPPPRYTEASLVKFLEEQGIGRPSTYTTIITTIIARNYVKREGKTLVPTPIGELTNKLMKQSFPDIVNYKFTAKMEVELDGIELGKNTMEGVLGGFWKKFEKELSSAEEALKDAEIDIPAEETDIICEKCGSRMIVKNGRFGKFAACPKYPQCKNTKKLTPPTTKAQSEGAEEKKTVIADFKCEKCGSDVVQRMGKYGPFFACVRYPACDFTKQKTKDIGVPCPKCGSKIVMKTGRNKTVFYSCEKYPKCDFSSWDMPVAEKCPQCGEILYRKKGQSVLVCHNKACGFKKPVED